MADEKKVKKPKVADPVKASMDVGTQEMLARAQALDIETIFDRSVKMKPCNIGLQGICCKNCAMGPCRVPLPKGGIEGEDTRKGLCGATANTIAARNFARMVAAGAAAHSDHGRCVAEVFLSAARKETDAYKIKDVNKLLAIAPHLGVATTVEVDGETQDRNIDEIALEVGEKALNEWGKAEGELLYLKRAPELLYEKWKAQGALPRNIDREIVEIMHRTHMGVDQDYKNITKQCTRASLADGWGGSMLATDLQDVLFGTPYPLQAEANLGVMKEDHVNIIVHGHEPVLSEMIVAMSQKPEILEYAKSKGAKGIQLGGICCTANEIFQRHGVPQAGTFLQQELAIVTGACDAMVVDIQCVFQNLANVAECFHTKLITTHPIAKMEQDSVLHIEFDEHHALEDAEKIVRMAIDNFQNREQEVMIPPYKASAVGGFSVESTQYHLGGTFRGTYYTLNDNIINGRIRGVAGVVGCNNARTRHNEAHIKVVKELIKNDVIVLTTGCNGIACAMEGLLTPESAAVYCGPGLSEICETVGIPPVLHMGSCVDNSRLLLAATEVVKAGGLGNDICDLPLAGSGAPVFHDYLSKEMENIYGGKWDLEADPIKHAQLMIAHIDKKRAALGIDKARDRVLMDMASRQALDA